MLGGGRFLFCAALVVGALSACADSAIHWGRAIDLGPGLYGRVHRLADGRFMAAYEKDSGIVARFAARDNLRDWGDEKVVAKGFVATNGAASVRVGLSNPEFAQLASGRIIYACNLRPHEWRHDIHPCGIALSTSDDGGQTWSALRTVYAPVPAMPVDGHPHGCYEPFVLPLRGGKAQIYFADETPYADEKCAWQNISFIETSDNGHPAARFAVGHREHIHLTRDVSAVLSRYRAERLVKHGEQTRAERTERIECSRLDKRFYHTAVEYLLRHSVKEIREG